ncbi:MAG: hypothetical protein AAB933_01095 [Patescibacteria group bacterium]
MNVRKCDICKKEIKMEDSVKAGVGYFADKEFCSKCGKPILDFLKKRKLLDEDKK